MPEWNVLASAAGHGHQGRSFDLAEIRSASGASPLPPSPTPPQAASSAPLDPLTDALHAASMFGVQPPPPPHDWSGAQRPGRAVISAEAAERMARVRADRESRANAGRGCPPFHEASPVKLSASGGTAPGSEPVAKRQLDHALCQTEPHAERSPQAKPAVDGASDKSDSTNSPSGGGSTSKQSSPTDSDSVLPPG